MITIGIILSGLFIGWLILLPFKLMGFAIKGVFRIGSALGWGGIIILLILMFLVFH